MIHKNQSFRSKIRTVFKRMYEYLLIKRSRLFDNSYYLNSNPDVNQAGMDPLWHYVCVGWEEGRNPSKDFDIEYYLSKNEVVKQIGGNPLIHYILFGEKEDRSPTPLSYRKKLIQNSKPTLGNKQNEITLFLHLGQDKTGTSSIQSFLDTNRISLFSEHGCLYPNFKEEYLISGSSNNHAVWYRKAAHDEKRLLSDFNRVLVFCREFKINKIILSNEGFFLKNEIINSSKILLDNNFPIIIKPICYLRRIDHWVESAWKQWGIKEYSSLDEYVDLPDHKLKFKKALDHLEMWSEIINVENIIVRPYEKQQLLPGLLHDFCSLIGIDYHKNKWQEEINEANIGFNRDVVEVLHICRNLFTSVHDNHLFHVFTDLLGDEFSKKPYESYQLLSPQKRSDLINHNFPFEREIARKFMGREDGRIFFDPLPDPDEAWEPYKGLSIEKVIPIIIKLIDSLHNKMRS